MSCLFTADDIANTPARTIEGLRCEARLELGVAADLEQALSAVRLARPTSSSQGKK